MKKNSRTMKRVLAMLLTLVLTVGEFGGSALAVYGSQELLDEAVLTDESDAIETETLVDATGQTAEETSLSADLVDESLAAADPEDVISGDVKGSETEASEEAKNAATLSEDVILAPNDNDMNGEEAAGEEVNETPEANDASDHKNAGEITADGAAYKKTQDNTLFRTLPLADPSLGEWNDDWKGSYVYYGRYDGKPIRWRILDKWTEDFSEPIGIRITKTPSVLLDCDSVLYESAFQDAPGWVNWDNSTVKEDLNGDKFYNKDGVLTAREKSAINESYKQEVNSQDGQGLLNVEKEAEHFETLDREKVFVLDSVEATNTSYGYVNKLSTYRSRMKVDKDGNGKSYWLRSTTKNRPLAGLVRNGGLVADNSVANYASNPAGVSPAMNINYDSVMFSTLVSGKKGQTGAEYKFTLIDNKMSITTTEPVNVTKQGVNNINYKVETTGQAVNNVSVLILDKEAYYYGGLINDANILYYDRLSTGKDEYSDTGTGNFAFPDGLSIDGWGKDYFVYLLAEQINEEKTTDYCSSLYEISSVGQYEIRSYPIWVGGEQVTEANKDNLCGGQAEYYPYEKKLTLKNATIDSYYDKGGDKVAIYSNLGNLNITGKATISGADYAIWSDTDRRKEKVNISATLDITATKCAICAGNLIFSGGNLRTTVKGGTKPVAISTRYFTVNGGFVKIQTEGYGCQGISTSELTANGGTVYVYATGDDARGIRLSTSAVVEGGYINAYAHDTSTTKTSVGIMLDDNTNSGRGILVYDGGLYCEGDWYALGSGGNFTFFIDERMELSEPVNGRFANNTVVNEDGTDATKVCIEHKDYYIQFDESSELFKYNSAVERYEALYTGSAICPGIKVFDRYGNQLKAGTHFTVKYSNNKNVDKKDKPATVTVKFKGNLSGTKKLQFYVVPVSFGPSSQVTLCDVFAQAGKKVAPELYYNGRKLTGKDFSITSKTGNLKFSASDDESNRKITITGKGNFTGAFTDVPVTIRNADETKSKTIKVQMQKGLSFVYNGKAQPIADNFKVTDANGNPLDSKYWNFKYVGSYTNVGTLKVIVWGQNGYTGSVVNTVTIKPDKDRATMNVTLASDTVMYTRSGAAPTVTVKATFPDSSTQTLVNGKDYSVAFSRNKQVTSSAEYKITFKGNYKGRAAMKGSYTITPAVLNTDNVYIFGTDKIYTKPGKYAAFPYMTYDGALLTGKDVTVTYKVGETDITNNKKFRLDGDVVPVDITITGKGNYTTGTTPIVVDDLYRIRKAPSGAIDLSKAKLTMKGNIKKKIPVQSYTGSEVCPDFDIYVKVGKTWMSAHEAGLSQGLDYRVEYVNNRNKGTATVVVTALSDSTKAMKSKTAKFKIGARNLTTMTWYKWWLKE